jgi:hypothetical protein
MVPGAAGAYGGGGGRAEASGPVDPLDAYMASVHRELDRTTNGSEWLTDVSGDGMWILALRCSTCYNPAPVFLTILDPQPVEK